MYGSPSWNRTKVRGFKGRCLTIRRKDNILERRIRFELMTNTLEGSDSTAELTSRYK